MLRAFFPSTFGEETLGWVSWSIDSPLIAKSLDFLNLTYSTPLFSARFAEKILSSSKGISLQNTWENSMFLLWPVSFSFFWCLINKVFGHLVAQALKNAYFISWLLLTPIPFLGCHFPGLSLSWSRFLLGCYFVEIFFF